MFCVNCFLPTSDSLHAISFDTIDDNCKVLSPKKDNIFFSMLPPILYKSPKKIGFLYKIGG